MINRISSANNPLVHGEQAAETIQAVFSGIRQAMEKQVFGQTDVINLLLTGLLSDGHVLLEGLPGTAKTTLVKTLAKTLGIQFGRIQLTPDLLPAEITGTSIYDLNSRTFSFREGPVFTDLLLADEINRTPPKTQSALLEAMAEKQVTADGESRPLSQLFTVFATLNPIELQGTFPLPEAQMDRFMMKVCITYPPREAEQQLLQQFTQGVCVQDKLAQDSIKDTGIQDKPPSKNDDQMQQAINPIASKEIILHCRQQVKGIYVEQSILDYVLSLILETRNNPNIQLGCSPRATLALVSASRAVAAIGGQGFVSPDNVKQVALAVMNHRMILTPDAEMEGLTVEQLIQQILHKVPVPR
jgi:MoxR-like ATPase